jgi:hypothetical protein
MAEAKTLTWNKSRLKTLVSRCPRVTSRTPDSRFG